MKKNVGSFDKILRVVIAIIAAYFAYKGGFEATWVEYVLWAVAIIMLLTTLMGSCPLYSIFGMNSCKTTKK